MTFRHLTPADYLVMPWKNGLGTTTEIACKPLPAGAGEGFVWRISIADVTTDGPFSKFPHVDRMIMLVEGKGMVLDAGPFGRLDLKKPFTPVPFEGDWPVYGRLIGGAVKDFNVMVDRRYGQADLEVMALSPDAQAVPRKMPLSVVYFFAPATATWPDGHKVQVKAGDTLVIDEAAATAPSLVGTGKAAVVSIRLTGRP